MKEAECFVFCFEKKVEILWFTFVLDKRFWENDVRRREDHNSRLAQIWDYDSMKKMIIDSVNS